jgi:hypothetical protein
MFKVSTSTSISSSNMFLNTKTYPTKLTLDIVLLLDKHIDCFVEEEKILREGGGLFFKPMKTYAWSD